jgi:outer membrane biosynthesis protein TonB
VRSATPVGTQPGVGLRRALSEAPTSVGPVVTTSIRPVKRRFLLPVAVALGVAAALLFWLRWEPAADEGAASATAQPSAVAAPVGLPIPTAPEPADALRPEPAEALRLEPEPAAEMPEAPVPSVTQRPIEIRPVKAATKPARPTKPAKPEKPAAPAAKANDLMSPY